jgi:Raf kinase inhibitor-like YbhB/YbcL family protein
MKKIILASALALGSAYGGAALAKSSQAPFTLSSSDFKPGQSVAHKHVFNGFGCTGENLSPALSWKNAPKGTKSFTLTVYDPDAPTGSGWWHWVVYNIPANATSLPASIGQGANLPAGAIQGLNDFSTNHYGGPCPPKGAQAHRYIVTLNALSVEKLDLPTNASPALVGFMSNANSLGKATLTVKYGR